MSRRSRAEAATAALKRHGWPLGLALGAGAFLRLFWIGDTTFLGDQAELLALGHSAIDHHTFIVTGILSSINTLNPPLSGWLYAPFSVLGGPVAGAVFTALANILAIGLLYALTTRYGGRLAGFIAALLYATASGPVHFSRFIWQQNLLAPLLILLLWAVLAGLVNGRLGWLGWAALWWGLSFQLHPTAAILLAPIGLALLLTWRSLRRRDIAWAVGALAVMYAPTLIWEVVSGGYDARLLTQFGGHGVTDLTAILHYIQLIVPALPSAYGTDSSYATVWIALLPLSVLMALLAAVSGLWLAYITVSPWLPLARAHGGWRAVIATPRWRLAAALLLWQATPLVALTHHSKPVPEHYLLIVLPAVYVSMGLWAVDAARWLERALNARAMGRLASAPRLGLVALTLALALAQSAGVMAELVTIHSGQSDGLATVTHLGIPLSNEQATLAAAEAGATRAGGTLAVAADSNYQSPYGYLAQTEGVPADVYLSDGCVLTPTASSGRPLVTLVFPQSFASAALPEMAGVRSLGTLAAQGSQPLSLYQLAPGAGPRGEVALPATGATSGARLSGYSVGSGPGGGNYLAVRWSGAPEVRAPAGEDAPYWYSGPSGGQAVAIYRVNAQPLDASGQPDGAPIGSNCSFATWKPGMDMVIWLPLATGQQDVAAWRLSLSAAPVVDRRPRIGPLALETGDVQFGAWQTLAGPVTLKVR